MKYLIIALSAFLPFSLGLMSEEEMPRVDGGTPLVEVLEMLGQPKAIHYQTAVDSAKIEVGRQLVYEGRARIPGGGKTRTISRFFICTDCHNQVQEDPVISVLDPEARLDYAISHDLPFLQATTFWGMSNRETWYNDDYYKKYGDLVAPARNSLAEATQLCAKECSSGRYLDEWELECIMQYYRTIDLKMSDIGLTENEMAELNLVLDIPERHQEAIDYIKQKYAVASPAHFGKVPTNTMEGYTGLTGNAERGKEIYQRSCQTCHSTRKCSQFILDDATVTFKKLVNHLGKHTDFNLYQITRKGTYAQPGHKQYMPMYPEERLSNQQVEDLRAYIVQEAEGF